MSAFIFGKGKKKTSEKKINNRILTDEDLTVLDSTDDSDVIEETADVSDLERDSEWSKGAR